MAANLETRRPPSPAGSEGSASSFGSSSSRKRDREDDEDGDSNRLCLPRKAGRPKKADPVLEHLRALSADIASLKQLPSDIAGIINSVKALVTGQASLQAISDRQATITEALVSKTDNLAKECSVLRQSLKDLRQEFEDYKASKNLEGPGASAQSDLFSKITSATNALCLKRPTTNHQNNTEIAVSGLTLAQGNDDDLLDICGSIAVALKVELQPGDLVSARLLRKTAVVPPENTKEPGASFDRPTRTTMAVVCKDRSIVSRLLGAKRAHGLLKLSALDNLTPAIGRLSRQSEDPVINVNELLPSRILKLLLAAKAELKSVGFKYVWCRDGTVFAKASDLGIVQIINSPADISRIVQLYTHAS